MRVKYDTDTNKITSWIESYSGINIIFECEFKIVLIGYIIEYNLIDYFLKSKEEREHDTDLLGLKDFNKFYGEVLPNESLTKEAIHWLQIGTDFMLTNYREYTIQTFLLGSEETIWDRENKIMKQYVIDNREEFPDVYLEILL